MTISYNWLLNYLPIQIDETRLSNLLTSVGLEVESIHDFEEIKGNLNGLVIGQVITCEKHPNADTLFITTVDIGENNLIQIVCGASNIDKNLQVIIAKVGTTIYPKSDQPILIKKVKIRGVESEGMICSSYEIGLNNENDGIFIVNEPVKNGLSALSYFNLYQDKIFEIGLTPNRMDAMSHWGVARDVCTYLSHHDKKELKPVYPNTNAFKPDNEFNPVEIEIENNTGCLRYSGVSISGVNVTESPLWLKQRLISIGLHPINNIVDITNFILHETGQPLHAFDLDKITGKKIIIKNLPLNTPFITLDNKEKKLLDTDLMICDSEKPLCMAGIMGGINSGVNFTTKNIFLESACFNSIAIRRSSFHHGLRSDAALRFEKGTDISATVNILKRAALLIKEIAGGEISSSITDIYRTPNPKTEIILTYHYLKKLSGKNYHPDSIKNILRNLGFEILKDDIDSLRITVPFHKPDVLIPADVVEEILRIDGLDNIAIPTSIHISPSTNDNYFTETIHEKISTHLTSFGFFEILTNSFTNSSLYSEDELLQSVPLLNSVNTHLNTLRTSLLETSLQVVSHNLNYKNKNLHLFEWGKSYHKTNEGKYIETPLLGLITSGLWVEKAWNMEPTNTNFFVLKHVLENIFLIAGIKNISWKKNSTNHYSNQLTFSVKNIPLGFIGEINKSTLSNFDIKQPVFFATIYWQSFIEVAKNVEQKITSLSKFNLVERDLSIVIDKHIAFSDIELAIENLNISGLNSSTIFDIFENEKLGVNKKSIAMNFNFLAKEKTFIDSEIDAFMKTIIHSLEKNFNAEIRK